MEPRTYVVTIRLTITAESDEHLQTPLGIEAEVESWLAGLRAHVGHIAVVEEAK